MTKHSNFFFVLNICFLFFENVCLCFDLLMCFLVSSLSFSIVFVVWLCLGKTTLINTYKIECNKLLMVNCDLVVYCIMKRCSMKNMLPMKKPK